MRLFCEVSALSFLESGNWIVWSNFLSKNLLDIFIKHSILYIILQEYLLVGLSPVFVFGLESEENLCAVCICVFLQCSECNVKRVFCNVQCAVGNVHVNTYTCIHIKYICIPYRSILKLSGVKNAKHATFYSPLILKTVCGIVLGWPSVICGWSDWQCQQTASNYHQRGSGVGFSPLCILNGAFLHSVSSGGSVGWAVLLRVIMIVRTPILTMADNDDGD